MTVQTENRKDRKWPWVVLGVILCLILATVGFLFMRSTYRQAKPLMPTPPPAQPTPTRAIQPTPTQAPAVPGNVWVVSATEVDVVYEGGYKYIVDEFSNNNVPTLKIRRQCGAPGAPAPEVGHEYTMNEYGVLVPAEGVNSPLQRFYEIK